MNELDPKPRNALPPTVGDIEIGPDGRKYRYNPIDTASDPTDPNLDNRGVLARGLLNTKADLANFGGLLADTAGMDSTARKMYDYGYRTGHEAGEINVPKSRLEDLDGSVGDYATFAMNSIGEQLPMLAFLGSATAAGVVAAPAVGFSALAGGSIAVFLANMGLQTGEGVDIALNNNSDPKDIRVVGAGLGKAMLDMWAPLAVAKRMGIRPMSIFTQSFEKGVIKDLTKKGFLSMPNNYAGRAAKDVATIVTREVPTESMQEVININLDRSFKELNSTLYDWTPEEASQIANAAAGATAFGLFGFGSAAVKSTDAPLADNATLLEEGATGSVSDGNLPPGGIPPIPPNFNGSESTGLTNEESYVAQLERELQAAGKSTITPQGAIEADVQMDQYAIGTEGAVKADPNAAVPPNMLPSPLVLQESGGMNTLTRTSANTQVYEDGKVTDVTDQEGMRNDAAQLAQIPPELRTPGEAASVDIETARQGTILVSPEGVAKIQVPKPLGVEKLEAQVADIYANEDSYRKDGGLKVAAQKKIDGRQKRIAVAYDKAGYKPQQDSVAAELPKTFAEAQEAAQVAGQQDIAPLYKELTQRESALLESLQEKEAEEGSLNDAEYASLEELEARALGEVETESRRPTARDNEGLDVTQRSLGEAEFSHKLRSPVVPKKRGVIPMERAKEILDNLHALMNISEKNTRYVTLTEAYMKKNYFLIRQAESSEGWYDPQDGTVNFVLDNFESEYRVVQAFFHEAVGHMGLRAMFSPTQWVDLVQSVLKTNRAQVLKSLRETHVMSTEEWEADSENYVGSFVEETLPNGIKVQHRTARGMPDGTYRETLVERNLGQVVFASHPREIGRMGFMARGASVWSENYSTALEEEVGYVEQLAVDEYLARIAGLNQQSKLMNRVILAIKKALRAVGIKLEWTKDDYFALIANSRKFIQKRGTNTYNHIEHMTEYLEKTADPKVLNIGRSEPGLDGSPVEFNPNKDVHSLGSIWRMKATSGVLTPLQMSERYGVAPVKAYLEQVQKWWARKRTLTAEPTKIAMEIDKIGKKQYEALTDAVFEIRGISEELERKLNEKELETVFAKYKLNKHTQGLWKQMDESFTEVLNQYEVGLEIQAIRNSYGKHTSEKKVRDVHKLWVASTQEGRHGLKAFNTLVGKELGGMDVIARLNKIRADINTMRKRNYFPNMRFGKWAVTWRDKDGKIKHFSTYLTYKERQRDIAKISKQFPEYNAYLAQVSDKEFSFLAMPPAMFDTLKGDLALTPTQQKALREIFYLKSPGRSFLKHLVKKKNTTGFSRELLRVYSTYMANSANHIARVEHHQLMQNELTNIGDLKKGSQNADKYSVLYDYFQDHFTYIMNPGNDLAKYRALGFLWYLGFNVKSAAVNLTQIPMVAYPFLASRYGDAKSVGAIAKAYKTITKYKTGGLLDPELDKALRRAIEEGFVDESQAVQLAGYAEDSTLQQLTTTNRFDQTVSKMSYYGAFLFQHAEKFNREVTFTAARDLHLQKHPQDFEGAFQAGRKAVQSSMFEYAKWNRPEFMRGKKSIFFLFWQYMQSLSFLAAGGEGKGAAMRVWGMLLLASGVQGLPFMENILDILDFGSTKAREALGMENPQVQLRDELREIASLITDNPDIVMHGLSRSHGLGALHLLELLGIETPDVDISGSLSAGRVIPGLGEALGTEKDPNTKFARTISEAMGPVLAVPFNFYKAMNSNDPNTWKVWERAMPVVMQSASKTARRMYNEEETFRGGGAVAKFEPQNMEHRAELIAQFFGFSTTRLNRKYELRNSQENMRRYWTVRRTLVMENLAYAYMAEDPEAIQAANNAIKKFNKIAPQGVGLTRGGIKQSIRQRFKRASLRENGIPNERFFIEGYLQKEPLYLPPE